MKEFWERYKFRIIGAILGSLFHLAVIVLVFVGEGQTFIIFWFVDFPITLVLHFLDLIIGSVRMFDSMWEWLGPRAVYYGYVVVGTLMYTLLGWLSGPFLKRQALIYGLGDRVTNGQQTEKDTKE